MSQKSTNKTNKNGQTWQAGRPIWTLLDNFFLSFEKAWDKIEIDIIHRESLSVIKVMKHYEMWWWWFSVVQCGHGLDPEGLLEKWEKEETERYFMESALEIVLSDDDSDQE